MSDLQCPARFVVLTPETAPACDLSGMRLALVVCACAADGTMHEALQRLAARHGCAIQAAELRDGAALATQISELADGYRGEQVAIIAGPEVVREALQLRAAPSEPIQLAVDSDGWNVLDD